jgi:hypothetical protein
VDALVSICFVLRRSRFNRPSERSLCLQATQSGFLDAQRVALGRVLLKWLLKLLSQFVSAVADVGLAFFYASVLLALDPIGGLELIRLTH